MGYYRQSNVQLVQVICGNAQVMHGNRNTLNLLERPAHNKLDAICEELNFDLSPTGRVVPIFFPVKVQKKNAAL